MAKIRLRLKPKVRVDIKVRVDVKVESEIAKQASETEIKIDASTAKKLAQQTERLKSQDRQ